MALVEQPPRPRRREGAEIRDGARPALLCEADSREQQLCGCTGVRQGTVARRLGSVEEPGELRETEPGDASREEGAREANGVDDGRTDSRSGQPLRLAVEEGEVEARVVGDEDG